MKIFKFMLRKIPSGYSFFYLIWIQCCLRKKLICFLFYHCISETYLANIFFHPTMYGWDSLSSLYTRDIMEIWRDSLFHFWSATAQPDEHGHLVFLPTSLSLSLSLLNQMNMDSLCFCPQRTHSSHHLCQRQLSILKHSFDCCSDFGIPCHLTVTSPRLHKTSVPSLKP